MDSECCRPSLKSTGEDKEETEQVTASRAAANEISADAAVAAVLSQLLCICTLKEGEIMALQAFRRGTVLFSFFCFFVFAKILVVALKQITAHHRAVTGIHEP